MSYQPNAVQQAIIHAPIEGAYRVLAGPGSGKTATMIHRIDHLITSGVDPRQIVAVTFAKSMAVEIGLRAQELNPAVIGEQICTIHALCYRILKEEGETREVAAGRLAYRVTRIIKDLQEENAMLEVGWKDLLHYINRAKANAIRHPQLPAFYRDFIQSAGGIATDVPWKDRAHQKLTDLHLQFERRLRQEQLLTFSDMLCEIEWLLADYPETCQKYQERYGWIIVDEGQDTSAQAMRILTNLAAPQDNFTIVGDADQTLYGFAGANPENNLWGGFEKRFPEHTTYKMEINYRSTPQIVDFTNAAIKNNYTEETRHYQKNLVCRPGAAQGPEVTFVAYANAWDEASGVVEALLSDFRESTHTWQDYFVCARTRAQLPYLYGPLFRNRIPFVDKCGGSFWDSGHIADVLAYLRLSVDRGNKEAFLRIYNKASINMKQPFDLYDKKTNKLIRARGDSINHRWLGKAFLEQCGGSYYGLDQVIHRPFAVGIQDLRMLMYQIEKQKTPSRRIDVIVQNCVDQWWKTAEGENIDIEGGRGQDFATLSDLATPYDTVEDFLETIDCMIEAMQQTDRSGENEVVVLSTIHRLKGLERPVVHVLGVMEGLLPHRFALGTIQITSVLPMRNDTTVESERCLFFVAVSRAKERVCLHGPEAYQANTLFKSRFLYETGLAESIIECYLSDEEEE